MVHWTRGPIETHLEHIPFMVLSSTHIITGNIISESDTCIRMGSYTVNATPFSLRAIRPGAMPSISKKHLAA
jgi:hypothetical protein